MSDTEERTGVIVVEDNFWITGRGIVVTGESDGLVEPGDIYSLNGGELLSIRGIERFVNMLGKPPEKGERIGLLVASAEFMSRPLDQAKFTPGVELHRMNYSEPSLRFLEAIAALSEARRAAGEQEGKPEKGEQRSDIIDPVQNAIFGLYNTIEALIDLMELDRERKR